MCLQGNLVMQAFNVGCVEKLVRAFGQDKQAVVPDLHLLNLSVTWHLDRLLGVLLNVLNVNYLSFLAHVRSGRKPSPFLPTREDRAGPRGPSPHALVVIATCIGH